MMLMQQEHDGVKAISGTELLSSKGNTTGATSGTGTDYPCGAFEFTPVVIRVRVARILVLCVVFCRSFGCVLVIDDFVIM